MQSAKECQSNDIDNQHYPVVKCILRSRDFAGIDRDFSRLERFEQGIVEQSHTKDRYRLEYIYLVQKFSLLETDSSKIGEILLVSLKEFSERSMCYLWYWRYWKSLGCQH